MVYGVSVYHVVVGDSASSSLKWREVFCFRGLWGHLSERNTPSAESKGLYSLPACSHVMGSTPYMEASAGIENIFKFLRIDYA